MHVNSNYLINWKTFYERSKFFNKHVATASVGETSNHVFTEPSKALASKLNERLMDFTAEMFLRVSKFAFNLNNYLIYFKQVKKKLKK